MEGHGFLSGSRSTHLSRVFGTSLGDVLAEGETNSNNDGRRSMVLEQIMKQPRSSSEAPTPIGRSRETQRELEGEYSKIMTIFADTLQQTIPAPTGAETDEPLSDSEVQDAFVTDCGYSTPDSACSTGYGFYASPKLGGGYVSTKVAESMFKSSSGPMPASLWAESKLVRYHNLLDAMHRKEKGHGRMALYEELSLLVNDFEATCESYARVIVSEVSLSTDQKTIKPLTDSNGVLGGEKFLVNDLFIKYELFLQLFVKSLIFHSF